MEIEMDNLLASISFSPLLLVRRQRVRCDTQGTRWSRRSNHSVELPWWADDCVTFHIIVALLHAISYCSFDGHLEMGTGLGYGLHGRPQARRADASHGSLRGPARCRGITGMTSCMMAGSTF